MFGQSLSTNVHNLSVSGPGDVKAVSELEICIFCHTPHSSYAETPLWNREKPGSTYILYNSSTTDALTGQPDGSAILCLSCHDGTIALGSVLSRSAPISFSSMIDARAQEGANLTTDLSDDHPISFLYNSSLALEDGQLRDPSTLGRQIHLENGKLQCISCHDPHDNTNGDFLVMPRQGSALCLECHDQKYWESSSHNTSTSSWNGSSPDPWFHTPYKTVADNACENCHNPHNAGGNVRLMKYATEEDNCLDCHNGNVAETNIQADVTKTYRHNVYKLTGAHDPLEPTMLRAPHVECSDCHNPHASNDSPATAPDASGALAGVRGIDQNGALVYPIQYEYELCFRCHTSTPGMPASATLRDLPQNNVMLEFATSNPSFHPVVGPRNNPEVPSLIAPLTPSSVIYCSDCHSSDQSNGPKGPHGSIYPGMLKKQYNKRENVKYQRSLYELCWDCHSENVVMSDNSFPEHVRHRDFSCNDCHDPHGISSTQGSTGNNSSLINFNTGSGKITPSDGEMKYVDMGSFSGNCTLTCHGKKHSQTRY